MTMFKMVFALLFLGHIECADVEILQLLQNRLVFEKDRPHILNEDALKDNFPYLESTCVKNALQVFLPRCLKLGIESIDSALRVETAARLSICEFEESGLEAIPATCQSEDINSLMECMIQLESSNQWWTTYSGNYQRLPTICFENALPYEKEQILQLFLNVTGIYEDFSEGMTSQLYEVLSKFNLVSDEYIQALSQMLQNNMDNYTREAQMHKEQIKREYNQQREDIHELALHNREELTTQFERKDSEFMEILTSVQSLIKNIELELINTDIATGIEEAKRQELERWTNIDEISSKALHSVTANKILLDAELIEFLEIFKEQTVQAKYELEYSRQQAMETFKDHDDMVRNHMLPALSETVLDFKYTILSEWQRTNEMMNQDISVWNLEISNSLRKLTLNLNSTLEKVAEINDKVTSFEGSLYRMFKILGTLFRLVISSFQILRYFILNQTMWITTIIAVICYKIYYKVQIANVNYIILKYTGLIFRWALIFFATYVGSKCGALLI